MTGFTILLIVAVVLQAGAFSAAVAPGVSTTGVVEPLLLHAAASAAFAWAVKSVPTTLGGRTVAGLALFAGLGNLVMPAIAPAGTLLAMWPAPRRGARKVRREMLPDIETPEPGTAPGAAAPSLAAVDVGGARDLWGILRHAPGPDQRVHALVATLRLDDAAAVPMLRFALRDAEDEVRLLAFALLTDRELACARRLREADGKQPSAVAKSSAYALWRLAEIAGVSGAASAPLCRRALQHAREALVQLHDDGGLHLLSVRLHLELGELTHASSCLEAAERRGFAPDHCARLRAELAFRSRSRPSDARS